MQIQAKNNRLQIPGNVELLVFDFDGVILDSEVVKSCVFAKIYEAESEQFVNKVKEYHQDNPGVSRRDKFKIFESWLGRNPPDSRFDSLCHQFKSELMTAIPQCNEIRGVRSFLEYANIELGLVCIILTAAPEEEVGALVKLLDLDQFFTNVYGWPRRKVDVLEHLCETVPNEKILFFGDSMSDLQAAQRSAVPFVAVGSNFADFSKDQLRNIQVILDFSDFCVAGVTDH